MFSTQETGKKISVLRRKAGMTQMELANRLGISYQAVSNWERGISMPDISNLGELAKLLGTTVDELIGDARTAGIVKDVTEGRQPNEGITPEEFVAISPVLTPEQNDLAAAKLTASLDKDQADEVKPNMAFGGDYESSDDELAEKFYREGNIAMFSVIESSISPECRSRIATKAGEDGNVAFFAMLYEGDNADALAEKFFERRNIALFSIVSGDVSPECAKRLYHKAMEAGDVAFFSVIRARANRGENSEYTSLMNKLKRKRAEYRDKKEERRRAKAEGRRSDAADLRDELEDLESEMEDLQDELEEIRDEEDDNN